MDMTNYYMERTSEEAFIDTAKLDSSVIKHGKNLGYNPIRNTPAEAEIAVVIRGPLPQALMATTMATIYFPQEDMELTYNGKKYILNTDYSYTLTRKDIEDGQSSTWTKTLYFSKPADSVNYVELSGEKLYNDASLVPIKVFQGEVKVDTIYGVSNTSKLGKSYQFYDIDNLKFSNWYGKRDPNGWYKDQFFKKNSWCKVGIGKNQDEAFTDENLYDIEDVSIYLNSELQKERTNNEYDLLNICSLTTNSDKTIRLRFGDGVNVSNGLNKSDLTGLLNTSSSSFSVASLKNGSASMNIALGNFSAKPLETVVFPAPEPPLTPTIFIKTLLPFLIYLIWYYIINYLKK